MADKGKEIFKLIKNKGTVLCAEKTDKKQNLGCLFPSIFTRDSFFFFQDMEQCTILES